LNIAIIPARGQSKRIPRKNIKKFHGSPIISYAIRNAIASGLFDEVIVSTDDLEIAKIAEQFGADVPWLRSEELSGDFVSTVSVMQDAVARLGGDTGDASNVCCIYPATPLLDSNCLSVGLKTLENGSWDYVISATLAEAPPERFLSLGDGNQIIFKYPEYQLSRTQDLGNSYRDAGQFYWGTKTAWFNGLPLFTSRSTIVEVPRQFAVDIDTAEDWHYAEALFQLYGKGTK